MIIIGGSSSVLPGLYLLPGPFIDRVVYLQHGGYGIFGYIVPSLASHGIVQLLFRRIDPFLNTTIINNIVLMMRTRLSVAPTTRNTGNLTMRTERDPLIGLRRLRTRSSVIPPSVRLSVGRYKWECTGRNYWPWHNHKCAHNNDSLSRSSLVWSVVASVFLHCFVASPRAAGGETSPRRSVTQGNLIIRPTKEQCDTRIRTKVVVMSNTIHTYLYQVH